MLHEKKVMTGNLISLSALGVMSGFLLGTGCCLGVISLTGDKNITSIVVASIAIIAAFVLAFAGDGARNQVKDYINRQHPEESKELSKTAEKVVKHIEMFNDLREKCDHHTCNTLTEAHNCYEGGTQSECNPILCPLKRKGY